MHSSLICSLLIIQKRMQECKQCSHGNSYAYSNKLFCLDQSNALWKKGSDFAMSIIFAMYYSWCTPGMARSIFFEHHHSQACCRKWNLQLALRFLCVWSSSCWDDPKVCGSLVLSNSRIPPGWQWELLTLSKAPFHHSTPLCTNHNTVGGVNTAY